MHPRCSRIATVRAPLRPRSGCVEAGWKSICCHREETLCSGWCSCWGSATCWARKRAGADTSRSPRPIKAVTENPATKAVLDAGRRKVADRVSPDPAMVRSTAIDAEDLGAAPRAGRRADARTRRTGRRSSLSRTGCWCSRCCPGRSASCRSPPLHSPAPGVPTATPLPLEVDRQLPSSLLPNQARQAGPARTDAGRGRRQGQHGRRNSRREGADHEVPALLITQRCHGRCLSKQMSCAPTITVRHDHAVKSSPLACSSRLRR